MKIITPKYGPILLHKSVQLKEATATEEVRTVLTLFHA